jgi:hypothetical protein
MTRYKSEYLPVINRYKALVSVVRPTKKSVMSLAQEKLVKSYFLPTSERYYCEDVTMYPINTPITPPIDPLRDYSFM